MPRSTNPDPISVCEEIVRSQRASNIEGEILPSETAILDRMLDRRVELVEAYRELYRKLAKRPHALENFFGVLTSTAAFRNPAKIAEARNGRSRLVEVNEEIAELAWDLAALLDERDTLHNNSGFSCNTHYHICDVISAASSGNYLYGSWVQERLEALTCRFDMKYWPSLGTVVQTLATDAEDAAPRADDPLTAAATTGRASRADFFKALLAAFEENRTGRWGQLPIGFKLSDSSLASFANVALGLGADELVDAAYVKRLRQRERKRVAALRRTAFVLDDADNDLPLWASGIDSAGS